MSTREATWDERILALVPSGVDRTLVIESLRLTPTERLARLQAMVAFVEQARAARDHAVPRTPRPTDPR